MKSKRKQLFNQLMLEIKTATLLIQDDDERNAEIALDNACLTSKELLKLPDLKEKEKDD